MDNSNIKVYLGISFALIILLILIIVIPFSKKTTTQNNTNNLTGQQVFPTSIEVNPSMKPGQNSIPADFTGVAEEELPPQILDTSLQKKDLRQQTPLELSAFTIDFDYAEDKFVVSLFDPKDQARQEFESWRTANYPGLGTEQFLIK